MTRKPLFIDSICNGYEPSQCGRTLTVRGLIELLSDFDEDRPVYLRFDNGYTYGSISYDDIATAEDLGEFFEEDLEPLYINANNNGYEPSQCGTTLTVGELTELLSYFDEDRRVYLRNDGGYTYGSIREYDFNTAEELEEASA